MNGQDFWPKVFENIISWILPAAGAFAVVVFSPLLERIKVRVDRANARSSEFERLAGDLSDLIYSMQLIHDYYDQELTEPEQIDPISARYNDAIYQVRRNEFVYMYWAKKYWKAEQLPLFVRAMAQIRDIDNSASRKPFNVDKVSKDYLKLYQGKIDALSQTVRELLD